MNNLLSTLNDIRQLFEESFNKSGEKIFDPKLEQFNNPGWYNTTWVSNSYRKAHINVIDVIDTRGLWMMHCCIYPHYNNPAPIFGFDVFAGKNKITGCFHDFSPVSKNHELSSWFLEKSSCLSWNKKRELPEWAQRIFSNDIIAAGNIQSDDELNQILSTITESIHTYLDIVGKSNNTATNVSDKHEFYIQNQRLNPHNPKVLMNLGLSEDEAISYVNICLFPNS